MQIKADLNYIHSFQSSKLSVIILYRFIKLGILQFEILVKLTLRYFFKISI